MGWGCRGRNETIEIKLVVYSAVGAKERKKKDTMKRERENEGGRLHEAEQEWSDRHSNEKH